MAFTNTELLSAMMHDQIWSMCDFVYFNPDVPETIVHGDLTKEDLINMMLTYVADNNISNSELQLLINKYTSA